MPEQATASCDVVGCNHVAAGSYLHLALDQAIQFGVCAEHLSQLKAGRQPTVVTPGPTPEAADARPALLLPPATGDH